jgi:hypothetical protein
VNVWAIGRERRGSGAKNYSGKVARYPLSTTHTIESLFELGFTWEAWNIERGLKEAVRKSTPLEALRRYLCLDGGPIQSQGSIQHIQRPRKDAQSERIVLISGSPCWRVLPVRRSSGRRERLYLTIGVDRGRLSGSTATSILNLISSSPSLVLPPPMVEILAWREAGIQSTEHVTRRGRGGQAMTNTGAFEPACYAITLEEVDGSAGDPEETPRDSNGV